MSIDEREDPDEELETVIEGIPFIINTDLIDSYGERFSISLDSDGAPVVRNVEA